MNDATIRRVIVLGALAILGVLGVQSYWVIRTWNLQEKEFNDKVHTALISVAEDLEKLGSQLPAHDLISQISTNYYVVNISDVFNAGTLEFYLRNQLEAVGLVEDFEYGIYDCSNNKMVYGNYISYDPEKPVVDKQRDDLPTYDEYLYYFGVRFPNRTGYLLNSMNLTVLFSLILLLTVSFFAYTLYIILRQKRLSEMQKDFINNMTHEFKTPISTIKISANTFLNHPEVKSDERLMKYASIINDQNNRLNSQVEKVLQIARIERDNFKLKKEPTDLHELLDKVIRSTKLKAEELGGSLNQSLNAQKTNITADKLHLTNIIHNLIDNAIKYRKETPEINISTTDSDDKIHLKIEDKGIGISKEQQGKVFQKFYRVPTGNVHNVKGFGLGLFYVKNICQAHGWKLQLDSEEGEGTTINILI